VGVQGSERRGRVRQGRPGEFRAMHLHQNSLRPEKSL
jgi:oxalate decarboxylase/phosphoglucose isomerase-like protein (cupin superfamily)